MIRRSCRTPVQIVVDQALDSVELWVDVRVEWQIGWKGSDSQSMGFEIEPNG